MSDLIIDQIGENIGTISINRPESKNALNLQCIEALIKIFRQYDSDPKIKCVILGSSSKEAFCSGADLKEFSEKKLLDEKTAYFNALADLICSMKRCSKPVITKVNGYALAGGLALVAAADLVLAANDAKFALPELKVGMVPGVVMVALEKVLNKRALAHLCLSADFIDAKEAFQIGLVSKVYDKAVLDKKVDELASHISSFSSESLITTKKMLSICSTGLEEALANRSAEMAAYSLTPACIEGIDAFLNKRKARWT